MAPSNDVPGPQFTDTDLDRVESDLALALEDVRWISDELYIRPSFLRGKMKERGHTLARIEATLARLVERGVFEVRDCESKHVVEIEFKRYFTTRERWFGYLADRQRNAEEISTQESAVEGNAYDPRARQPKTLGELERWFFANEAFMRATMIPPPISLNPPPIPGLDRLAAYCAAKFGQKLSVETIARLIGEFVLARDVPTDQARAASLQDVADTLAPKAPAPNAPPAAEPVLVSGDKPGDGRPRNPAELLAWCEDKMRFLAERVRVEGASAAIHDLDIHRIGRDADALARAFCPPELVLSLPVVPPTFPHVYDHHKALTVLYRAAEWCRNQLAATSTIRPSPSTNTDDAQGEYARSVRPSPCDAGQIGAESTALSVPMPLAKREAERTADPRDQSEARQGEVVGEPETSNLALPTKKAKRSTEQGEGRDKIIPALAKHHQYENGSCLNHEPIVGNELARIAKVGKGTVNRFFNRAFNDGEKGGYAKYKRACRDQGKLVTSLKLLLGEVTPSILFKTSSKVNELEATDK
jgi:hypothetical protein